MKKTFKNLMYILTVVFSLLSFGIMSSAAEEGTVSFTWKSPMYKQMTVDFDKKYGDGETAEEITGESDITYYDSVDKAGEVVREKMKNREEVFSVHYVIDEKTYKQPDWFENLFYDLFYEAVEHTGDGKEGDAILWCLNEISAEADYEVVDGYCYSEITFFAVYYTTAEQEAELDEAVEEVVAELDIGDGTNYEISQAIYDYLCQNITYDYEHLDDEPYYYLMHTAYAALIDKTAVCQGYAVLYYRLALEFGMDARFIGGYSGYEGHAWNIVRMGDKYYNLDSTWDAGLPAEDYQYYLRGSDFFDVEHYRDPEYVTKEFLEQYPVPEEDFDFEAYNPEYDHVHFFEFLSYTAPTCTTEGNKVSVCYCGEENVIPVPATGHSLGEYVVTTAETCTEKGEETAYCQACDYSETREREAAGHSYQALLTSPTCTEGGYTTFTCSVCSDSYVDNLTEKAGHRIAVIQGAAATCTAEGKTEGLACSVCGLDFVPQETIAVLPHTDADGNNKCDICKGTIQSQAIDKPSKNEKPGFPVTPSVPGDTDAETTVTGFAVKKIKTKALTFSWKAVEGADGYVVYYSADGGKWLKIETPSAQVTVNKLKAGQKYLFKVVAITDGEQGEESEVFAFSTKPVKCAVKSVASSSKGKITVTWNKTVGAQGYEVLCSTNKKFTAKTTKKITVKKAKKVKAAFKKLSSGKKYFVKIRAYKIVNGQKLYGSFSKVKTVKVK